MIEGTGTLTKIGAGTLTLSGANTYTGTTTISGGALALSSDSNQTLTGVISGAGNLTKSGTGTLTLTADNIGYTGATTISAGTLLLGHDAALGRGAVSIAAGATLNNANYGVDLARFSGAGTVLASNQFTYTSANNHSLATILAGAAALNMNGAGTLTLSGNNSYTGNTTVSQGTLRVTGTLGNGNYAGRITNVGELIFASASDQLLSGQMIWGGNLTQAGTGTLTLSGTNSYTGTTTITSGSLVVSGRLGGGSYAGSIANNSALTFASSSSQGLSGVISGSGSLTKTNSGTLTLYTANTYTGATNILGGTLTLTGPGRLADVTAVTVDGGDAIFDLNQITQTIGSLAGGGQIRLGSGNLTIGNANTSTTFSGYIWGNGTVSKSGTGTLTLSGSNSYTGTTTILGGTLNVSGTLGAGNYSGNIANAGALTFSSASNQILSGVLSGSGSLTKSNTGTLTLSGANTYTGGTTLNAGTLRFSDAANFGTGSIALNGGILQWAENTVADLSARLDALAAAATFDTNGNDVTFASALSGSGTLTKVGSGTLTLSGNNTYSGDTTIVAGTLALGHANALGSTGSISIASGAMLNASTYNADLTRFSGAGTLTGSGSFTYNSAQNLSLATHLAGSANLAKTGTGALTLSGANAYTGTTAINSGQLIMGHATALGTGAVSVATGATLNASTYGFDLNRLSGAGTITSSGAYTAAPASDTTLAMALAGTASLTKTGTTTLTLSGNNTYTGGTTISAGTLQFGNGGTGGALTGDIVNNAALIINRSSHTFLNGTISGTGSLTKSGSGGLILLRDATHTGGTIISSGVIQIGASTTTGSIAGNVAVSAGASLTFARTDALTYGGVLSGDGRLTQFSGVLTLTGNNTYTGGTTISGGLVNFASGANLGTGTITLNGGGLQWAAENAIDISSRLTAFGSSGATFNTNGNNVTFASVLSSTGSGALIKSGTGTLTLSGVNTYTGGTTVNAGTLAAGNASAFGSGAVRVDAGTLDLGGYAVANALDVRGGTLTGLTHYSGTQTLSGAMRYTGPVGGSLVIANGGSLNTTGATFSGATTVQSGGRVSGIGSLASLTLNSGATLAPGNSPGTLTVTGNATWNGGANYEWQLQNATGTAGTGYDLVSISGSLTIAASSTSQFAINILSIISGDTAGNTINFNSAVNSSYTIASASGGIIGFDANAFTINANGFTNNLNGGSWNLSQVGNNLNLNFAAVSAIPEPSTYAAMAGTCSLLLVMWRKRRKA